MRTGRVLIVVFALTATGVARAGAPSTHALDVVSRANAILDGRRVAGRSPAEWLRWSQTRAALATATVSTPTPTPASLASAALNLYAAMGLPGPTTSVRDELEQRAAALSPALAQPFADLVSTVAGIYAAQLRDGRAIVARTRAEGTSHGTTVTGAEREAMLDRQSAILSALATFRSRAAGELAATHTATPLFEDPYGLLILGGSGNDTYTRNPLLGEPFAGDPVLLVDPSGADTYKNSAGGACMLPFTPSWLTCNGLAVSVVADLGPEKDTYSYAGAPGAVQGAGGPGSIGMLVDYGGNDVYTATMTRATPAFETYFDGGAQGYGFGGAGLLLDLAGNDTYTFNVVSKNNQGIWAFAQGFGAAGGVGAAADQNGDDKWISTAGGMVGTSPNFEGLYDNGVGFYGGVGINTDSGGGNDSYNLNATTATPDFYAVGFGAFAGLGVFYDDAGNDTYYTYEQATSAAPIIDPILNCALGSASYGGTGVMVEGGGDDSYTGISVSTKSAYVMDNGFGGPGAAYGLFVDLGGSDHYYMKAQGTGSDVEIAGRGQWEPDEIALPDASGNSFGTFVDAGGDTDSYKTDRIVGSNPATHPPLGGDNTTWMFGIDF